MDWKRGGSLALDLLAARGSCVPRGISNGFPQEEHAVSGAVGAAMNTRPLKLAQEKGSSFAHCDFSGASQHTLSACCIPAHHHAFPNSDGLVPEMW